MALDELRRVRRGGRLALLSVLGGSRLRVKKDFGIDEIIIIIY
jgi:hypothetical protein